MLQYVILQYVIRPWTQPTFVLQLAMAGASPRRSRRDPGRSPPSELRPVRIARIVIIIIIIIMIIMIIVIFSIPNLVFICIIMCINCVVCMLCKLLVRPVHLLRVFLLRVLESNFPGTPPIKFYRHENSHPLELRVCLSQTL